MNKILYLLFISIISILNANEVILKLDTKGHSGIIKDVIVTNDGSEIISTGIDKVIYIWDSKTGQEKRKILGQIGSGSNGKIFAIALSPNDKYLAVGGYFDTRFGVKNASKIRIYEYSSGKLLRSLISHSNVVNDLSFSKDGKFLVSGSSDKSVKVWEVDNFFELKDTIGFHRGNVNAVAIIKRGNSYFTVTAGNDSKVALCDIQKRKIIKFTKVERNLGYIAVSDEHIAVSGDAREIRIYDFDLKLIKVISTGTRPWGLKYSKNNKLLISGLSSEPNEICIYDTKKNYLKKIKFTKHTNTVMGVGFLDNNTAISANSYDGIHLWDVNTAKIKKRIIGVGSGIYSVGINDNKIAWGNKPITYTETKYHKGILEKSINLNNFKIQNIKNANKFHKISRKNLKYSLLNGGITGPNSIRDSILYIDKKYKTVVEIHRTQNDGYRHICYGWYKDFIVSAGAAGHLYVYNIQGKKIASLVGHIGEIQSLAIDGDKLVSGGLDQMIKIWDLSFLRKIIKNKEVKTIYPLLNLFISKDNEYVAWTKDGFFNASKNGSQYIGYHINQGIDKEARFVGVDKLYDIFYRPDLVAKALNGEDISKYAKGIDIDKILAAGLAPRIAIETKSQKSIQRDINLNLEVCTIDDGGYDNLTLLLNGTAVDIINKDRALKKKITSKTKESCFTFEKLISLTNGENIIGFKATNQTGNIDSNTDSITINYDGKNDKKPNLYILAIGIDKYNDGDLRLKYSTSDAKIFGDTVSSVSKSLFENIEVKNLLDEEVTKENILKTFEKIGAKTTREDVFMLYIAGHGVTDVKTGSYFYLPVDFRYKNEDSVREKGISQNDFKLALSKIQAMKSLTILDTCNSGSFTEAMASRGVLQKTAISKLTRATGRATLVASSKDQVALEGYKGHGVFTYTLVEALKGKGYGSDSKITIKELVAYIEDVLPDRIYEKWGYEQVPQSHIIGNDFPIGIK